MKQQPTRRLTLAFIAVAALYGAVTACTSGTPAPGASHTSALPPQATLPAFPTVPQQNLLVSASNQSGQKSYTTPTLTSRALTIQLACVGGGNLAVSVQVFQGAAKPIYQISRQPCEGSIQKITLTADSTAPLKMDVSSPSGAVYSLMVTQG
jgi:hypothetical protein